MLNFQIGNLVSLMLLGEKMCINLMALPWAKLFRPFRANKNKGLPVIIGFRLVPTLCVGMLLWDALRPDTVAPWGNSP